MNDTHWSAAQEREERIREAAPSMYSALDRISMLVGYVITHGVGPQPEPREDGSPQPVRVSPEEFQRIFREIGRIAGTTLAKVDGADA